MFLTYPRMQTSPYRRHLNKGINVLVLLGYIVVLGAVFGGYLLVGGELGALYQPAELLIIGGAGLGAFIVGNNGKAIKSTLNAIPKLFRASRYNKSMYMDLM